MPRDHERAGERHRHQDRQPEAERVRPARTADHQRDAADRNRHREPGPAAHRLAHEHAEDRGENRRERLHEEDVRDRGVVQRDDERAGGDRHQRGDGKPSAAHGVERAQHRAALDDGDVREQPEHGKERAPRELRRDTDRELALQDPRSRPGDRRERDEGASPPLLRAERQGRSRVPTPSHRRIESACSHRSEEAVRPRRRDRPRSRASSPALPPSRCRTRSPTARRSSRSSGRRGAAGP